MGNTKIINLNNCYENWIKNGVKHIKGFKLSDNTTDWESIYDDWKKGEGASNSLIYGRNHPMNKEIMKSNSFNDARNTFIENTKKDTTLQKQYIQQNFGLSGVVLAGTNMTMQMIGSYGVSFYEIGEFKRVVMITDNKTRESFYYHGLYLVDIENIERDSKYGGVPESTTNQTYIWVDYNQNDF